MRKFPLLSLIVASFSQLTLAQTLSEAQLDSIERQFDLSTVVVTATRTPKALKDVPVQTRVITAEEIRRTDATDIRGLLEQELPGVEFSYAMNQQVNMNLAGFAGQSVLILVDGERLAGETMDNVDFSRLTMNGVQRIEIIRGAASALYGSNAAGGVINIITSPQPSPQGEGALSLSGNLGSRYGSHGEWRANGLLGVKGRRVENRLDASFNRINTYDVCADASDDCDFRHVYGFTTYNFNDRLTIRFGKEKSNHHSPQSGGAGGGLLTARAGYYFKERLYNPDVPDRYRDFTGGLRGEWQITAKDKLEASYAFDQYDKSDFVRSSGLDLRDYRNVQHTFRALYSHSFRQKDALTVGADVMRDYLESYQFAEGESRQQVTADAFAQYDWNVTDRLELVGALRYDAIVPGKLENSENSDGASVKTSHNLTSKFNVRYRLGHVTLRGGYAQGFRAPTLKERYMDFDMASIFNIHGNPALKAETSHNFNLSAEWGYKGYSLTLGGNYNLVDNRISTSTVRYDNGAPYIDYINIKDMRVFGLDATARARWRCGIDASLGYCFTHEETRGGSVTQYCPARPHSLNAKVSWTKEWLASRSPKDKSAGRSQHAFWSPSTTVTLSGRVLSAVSYTSMYMYEPFAPRLVRNPAYTLWRLQLVQGLWRGVQLTASIDNIFNYRPVIYTFNSPVTSGTTFQVGLNIDIDKLL